MVGFIITGNRFSKSDSHFNLAGGHHGSARPAESIHITQVRTSRENAQFPVENTSLPYDLRGVLHVGAQNKASRVSYTGLFKYSLAQNVSIQGVASVFSQMAHGVQV